MFQIVGGELTKVYDGSVEGIKYEYYSNMPSDNSTLFEKRECKEDCPAETFLLAITHDPEIHEPP